MSDRFLPDLSAVAELAKELIEARPEGGVIGLVGDLGAGKTTFVRACIEAICARSGIEPPRVVSPTYAIQQSYADLEPPVEHFDLYRLNQATEEVLIELGYYETLSAIRARKGFVFVEWPQRAMGDALRLQETLEFRVHGEDRKARRR